MAKNSKTNFDAELFAKQMRQVESDDGDGAVALTLAKRAARNHNPPLTLAEAVVKYMSPPRPSMDEVEDENARLEDEVANLRNQVGQLNQQVANLSARNEADNPNEEHDFGQLVECFYGNPQGRIVAFFALWALRLGVYLKWEGVIHPGWFWTINLAFLIPVAMVLLDWISLQFKCAGLTILLMRGGIMTAGLLAAYSYLFGAMPWDISKPIAHTPSCAVQSPEWAFAILAGATLLACSKAAPSVRKLFRSVVFQLKPIQAIRGMF